MSDEIQARSLVMGEAPEVSRNPFPRLVFRGFAVSPFSTRNRVPWIFQTLPLFTPAYFCKYRQRKAGPSHFHMHPDSPLFQDVMSVPERHIP